MSDLACRDHLISRGQVHGTPQARTPGAGVPLTGPPVAVPSLSRRFFRVHDRLTISMNSAEIVMKTKSARAVPMATAVNVICQQTEGGYVVVESASIVTPCANGHRENYIESVARDDTARFDRNIQMHDAADVAIF